MPKVTIYTTTSCVFCKMTKEFFKEHNVVYEEKNAAADPAARDELIQKSGQLGVPVIDVDGKLIIGFDQAQLRQLLGVK